MGHEIYYRPKDQLSEKQMVKQNRTNMIFIRAYPKKFHFQKIETIQIKSLVYYPVIDTFAYYLTSCLLLRYNSIFKSN